MKTYFWEVSPGNQSANRLIFIVGTIWLMWLTTYVITNKLVTPTEGGVFFATIFALLAGAKLVQNNQEGKPLQDNKEESTENSKNTITS
jgi:hypothetical protein